MTINLKKIFSILLFSLSFSFLSALTWEEARLLKVIPVSEYFFTGQNCEFDLRIPDLDSSKVTFGVNTVSATTNLQKNKNFVSMNKEEYIDDNGKRGTIVKLIYNFSETGHTKLPLLDVYLRGVRYRIPFENTIIYENPATIQCEVFTDIPARNIKLGDEIEFTVYMKFAIQVLGFSYELPKNSIFEEIQRYEILEEPKTDHNFSPSALPLAKFKWKPLIAGEFNLPDFKIVATNYNGSRSEPKIIEEKIVVSKKTPEDNLSSENFVYSKNFWEEDIPEKKSSDAFSENSDGDEKAFEEKIIPVFSVPEKKSRISAQITSNTKYKIVDETKNYYLIKAGKISGWIEKE